MAQMCNKQGVSSSFFSIGSHIWYAADKWFCPSKYICWSNISVLACELEEKTMFHFQWQNQGTDAFNARSSISESKINQLPDSQFVFDLHSSLKF